MSKLSQTEREDLYREKARNDAERGDFNPPGLSLGEKLGLTFVTCGLGAAAFLDNTQARDRAAYEDEHARAVERNSILRG